MSMNKDVLKNILLEAKNSLKADLAEKTLDINPQTTDAIEDGTTENLDTNPVVIDTIEDGNGENGIEKIVKNGKNITRSSGDTLEIDPNITDAIEKDQEELVNEELSLLLDISHNLNEGTNPNEDDDFNLKNLLEVSKYQYKLYKLVEEIEDEEEFKYFIESLDAEILSDISFILDENYVNAIESIESNCALLESENINFNIDHIIADQLLTELLSLSEDGNEILQEAKTAYDELKSKPKKKGNNHWIGNILGAGLLTGGAYTKGRYGLQVKDAIEKARKAKEILADVPWYGKVGYGIQKGLGYLKGAAKSAIKTVGTAALANPQITIPVLGGVTLATIAGVQLGRINSGRRQVALARAQTLPERSKERKDLEAYAEGRIKRFSNARKAAREEVKKQTDSAKVFNRALTRDKKRLIFKNKYDEEYQKFKDGKRNNMEYLEDKNISSLSPTRMKKEAERIRDNSKPDEDQGELTENVNPNIEIQKKITKGGVDLMNENKKFTDYELMQWLDENDYEPTMENVQMLREMIDNGDFYNKETEPTKSSDIIDTKSLSNKDMMSEPHEDVKGIIFESEEGMPETTKPTIDKDAEEVNPNFDNGDFYNKETEPTKEDDVEGIVVESVEVMLEYFDREDVELDEVKYIVEEVLLDEEFELLETYLYEQEDMLNEGLINNIGRGIKNAFIAVRDAARTSGNRIKSNVKHHTRKTAIDNEIDAAKKDEENERKTAKKGISDSEKDVKTAAKKYNKGFKKYLKSNKKELKKLSKAERIAKEEELENNYKAGEGKADADDLDIKKKAAEEKQKDYDAKYDYKQRKSDLIAKSKTMRDEDRNKLKEKIQDERAKRHEKTTERLKDLGIVTESTDNELMQWLDENDYEPTMDNVEILREMLEAESDEYKEISISESMSEIFSILKELNEEINNKDIYNKETEPVEGAELKNAELDNKDIYNKETEPVETEDVKGVIFEGEIAKLLTDENNRQDVSDDQIKDAIDKDDEKMKNLNNNDLTNEKEDDVNEEIIESADIYEILDYLCEDHVDDEEIQYIIENVLTDDELELFEAFIDSDEVEDFDLETLDEAYGYGAQALGRGIRKAIHSVANAGRSIADGTRTAANRIATARQYRADKKLVKNAVSARKAQEYNQRKAEQKEIKGLDKQTNKAERQLRKGMRQYIRSERRNGDVSSTRQELRANFKNTDAGKAAQAKVDAAANVANTAKTAYADKYNYTALKNKGMEKAANLRKEANDKHDSQILAKKDKIESQFKQREDNIAAKQQAKRDAKAAETKAAASARGLLEMSDLELMQWLNENDFEASLENLIALKEEINNASLYNSDTETKEKDVEAVIVKEEEAPKVEKPEEKEFDVDASIESAEMNGNDKEFEEYEDIQGEGAEAAKAEESEVETKDILKESVKYTSLKEACLLDEGYFLEDTFIRESAEEKQAKLVEQIALLLARENMDPLYEELLSLSIKADRLQEACIRKYKAAAETRSKEII